MIDTGGGSSIGRNVKAGRFVGRDAIIVRLDRASEGLDQVQAELSEVKFDVKLLSQLGQERGEQIRVMQAWIIMEGISLLLLSVVLILFVFAQLWR